MGSVIFCVFTSCVVCLRLWVRSRGAFGADDWAMLAAFCFYCIYNVINLVAVFGSGFGFHLYDLSMVDIRSFLIVSIGHPFVSYESLQKKLEFLHVIFLFGTLQLCRCSILHLLLRLSHLQSRGQQIYLRSVLGLSYAYLGVCVIFELTQCGQPIHQFELVSQFDGTCLGSRSMWAYGLLVAGHLGLDALTIFPPLVVLARLPLAPGKKFNLIFLLILGVFTMIFGAIRLYGFYRIMVDSYDLTWNGTAVAFWGILETSVAAIIVCLPALNQIMIKVFRRLYRGDEGPHLTTVSTRRGISIFERNFISQAPTKFLSSSADGTVSGGVPDYVELGEIDKQSKTTNPAPRPTAEGSVSQGPASRPGPEGPIFRTFYLGDDPESGNNSTENVTRPARAQVAKRVPPSPTISFTARQSLSRR
ncbi:hypothetical protein TWF730_003760 [Orbilia blumenaviensis]|uniref:Rhodopsin domain-containing protein n=1 Tax=Orbilia blumenaviensis TaxID=1796055 RepID=A0AAV9U3Y6_9PEZI